MFIFLNVYVPAVSPKGHGVIFFVKPNLQWDDDILLVEKDADMHQHDTQLL